MDTWGHNLSIRWISVCSPTCHPWEPSCLQQEHTNSTHTPSPGHWATHVESGGKLSFWFQETLLAALLWNIGCPPSPGALGHHSPQLPLYSPQFCILSSVFCSFVPGVSLSPPPHHPLQTGWWAGWTPQQCGHSPLQAHFRHFQGNISEATHLL